MHNIILEIEVLSGARYGVLIVLNRESSISELKYILEDEPIAFNLYLDEAFQNAKLSFNDLTLDFDYVANVDGKHKYQIKPKYDSKYGYYAFYRNYFGFSYIKLTLSNDEQEPLFFNYEPIDIQAKKFKAEQAKYMLLYLTNKLENIAEQPFSVTTSGRSAEDGQITTLNYLLNKAEIVINKFIETLVIFKNKKLSKLSTEQYITDYTTENMSNAVLDWMVDNPDYLYQTSKFDENAFNINNQHFAFEKIMIEKLISNTDIFENQVLHGIIASINSFLMQSKDELEKNSKKYKPQKGHIDNEYLSFFTVMKNSTYELFGDRITRINTLLYKCNEISKRLTELLPISSPFLGLPRITHKVKSNRHYRIIFEYGIDWYQRKMLDFSFSENLYGLKSIDKLYELYSLYQLKDSLNELGYLDLPTEWDTRDIATSPYCFNFHMNNKLIKLYYEKEIYFYTQNRKDNYFRSDQYRFFMDSNKARLTMKKYPRKPDYLIEIIDTNKNSTSFMILDAKYSTFNKVCTEKIPECILKYVNGISPISNEIRFYGLILLYPGAENENLYTDYHCTPFDLNAMTPTIPIIGMLRTTFKDEKHIRSILNKIIELTDN